MPCHISTQSYWKKAILPIRLILLNSRKVHPCTCRMLLHPSLLSPPGSLLIASNVSTDSSDHFKKTHHLSMPRHSTQSWLWIYRRDRFHQCGSLCNLKPSSRWVIRCLPSHCLTLMTQSIKTRQNCSDVRVSLKNLTLNADSLTGERHSLQLFSCLLHCHPKSRRIHTSTWSRMMTFYKALNLKK